jgi:hemolysin activation/secretion protein
VLLPNQSTAPEFDHNGKRFQVHSFNFVGATAFSAMQLKRVVERFVDLELNLNELNQAADAVTEFYHDNGYTLERTTIPAQRIDDGVVTLVVIEGRLGSVLFSGNKLYSHDLLQHRVDNLTHGKLLETRTLERNLLLLNDLPGLEARATLSPGAEFGTSDVLIKVEERRLGGSLTADNTGRVETGQARLVMNNELNNPLGIGDQLKLQLMETQQKLSRSGSISYSIPLGTDGLRLAIDYSDLKYDLAGTFAALGIQGSARTTDLSLSWPLTRSRSNNEMLVMTARQTRLIQYTLGEETSNILVPMLDFSYLANWIGKDASVSNLLTKVSSNLTSNTDGTSKTAVLYKLEVDGNYLLPLNRYWDFYFRGDAAYSPYRLPDSEKYSVGGESSVRAYRTSELRGDTGWQSTFEFRRALNLARIPASAVLFGDIGSVTYKMPGFSNAYNTISAWGCGLTLYPIRRTTVKFEFAMAGYGDYLAGDGITKRLWININTNF